MRTLADYAEMSDQSFLVKFVSEEHLDDLLDGLLFMKNLGYFIELEKQSGEKGRGDKLEAAHVMRPELIKIFNPETKELLGTAYSGEVVERYDNSKKVPVFCFTAFHANEFVLKDEDDEFLYFKLEIHEDELNRLRDFGEKAVMLPGDEFINKIMEAAELKGDQAIVKSVDYLDYSVVDEERKKKFDNGHLDMFFWKDDYFSFQREVRLVLPSKMIDDCTKFDIGSIREESNVLDIEMFLNNLALAIPKN